MLNKIVVFKYSVIGYAIIDRGRCNVVQQRAVKSSRFLTSRVKVRMTSTFDREGSGSSETSTLATPE